MIHFLQQSNAQWGLLITSHDVTEFIISKSLKMMPKYPFLAFGRGFDDFAQAEDCLPDRKARFDRHFGQKSSPSGRLQGGRLFTKGLFSTNDFQYTQVTQISKLLILCFNAVREASLHS